MPVPYCISHLVPGSSPGSDVAANDVLGLISPKLMLPSSGPRTQAASLSSSLTLPQSCAAIRFHSSSLKVMKVTFSPLGNSAS